MKIVTRIETISSENWLILSRFQIHRPFLSHWVKAILWNDTIYPYEGIPVDYTLHCILFSPDNEEELLLCLKEALLSYGGREEIEWVNLALIAIDMGISPEKAFHFFQAHLPLFCQQPDFWKWLQDHKELVVKAVTYGISLRLLIDWKDDNWWINWLFSSLDILQANGNQYRQIRQGFLSLLNGKKISFEEILKKLQWDEIVTMREGPAKRLEILLNRLKVLRYPVFSYYEGRLQSLSANIRKKTGWEMKWPPFLEGNYLSLHISLRSEDDFLSLGEKSQLIVPEMREAIALLRGEEI